MARTVNIPYDNDELTKGNLLFDFYKGTVTTPAGTESNLPARLDQAGHEYIRSLSIFVSMDADLTYEGDDDNVTTLKAGWNIIRSVLIKKIRIQTTFTQTPDVWACRLVASTSSTPSYQPGSQRITGGNRQTALTTADAYATKLLRDVEAFVHHTVYVLETGAANGLTFKIDASLDGVTFWNVYSDTAVAASGEKVVQLEGVYHHLRVQAKSTAAGNSATFTLNYGGMG